MQKEKIARKVMPYDNEDKLETLEQWENRGGVTTFPVIRHTSHESYEGCNIFRQTNTDDNSNKLYQFINNN
jgi:hypothetical protein